MRVLPKGALPQRLSQMIQHLACRSHDRKPQPRPSTVWIPPKQQALEMLRLIYWKRRQHEPSAFSSNDALRDGGIPALVTWCPPASRKDRCYRLAGKNAFNQAWRFVQVQEKQFPPPSFIVDLDYVSSNINCSCKINSASVVPSAAALFRWMRH